MRLRLVHRGDFRKSELTLYQEVKKANKGLKLGRKDVVLLISGNGKILKFVHGFTEQDVVGRTGAPTGKQTQVLESAVLRIAGTGAWNPLMLANYAEQVGIHLDGIKRFEEYYRALR